METSPTDTTVKAGSTALFSCFVPAAEKITWFKDGRQAVSTDYAVRLKTTLSCRLPPPPPAIWSHVQILCNGHIYGYHIYFKKLLIIDFWEYQNFLKNRRRLRYRSKVNSPYKGTKVWWLLQVRLYKLRWFHRLWKLVYRYLQGDFIWKLNLPARRMLGTTLV